MPSSRAVRPLLALLLLPLLACRRAEPEPQPAPLPASASATLAPLASSVAPASSAPPAPSCPAGMKPVAGGVFWMGHSDGLPEESPRHPVAVRSFCLDATEVTVAAHRDCERSGACSPPHRGPFCNTDARDRDDHPVNCVDWHQAVAFCARRGARLPTEREWEFAARNGAEQRIYAWGNELPDGRCCYSHEGTCKVGSYAPNPSGLVDLTGNVWEWTSSAFGAYPDEHLQGPIRVYRGGSFSRRFPKWMRNGLRNRARSEEWGAHLGFRCALDLDGAPCPDGSSPDPSGRSCLPSGLDAPHPAPSTRLLPSASSARPASSAISAPSAPEPVSTSRDPRFDADCSQHKPGRPVAYLVKGGSFADRQRARGPCVNRDVGVGFNSVCCAQ